jgi:gamma-glutamyltranspeptidase/glutathione hydrolase
MDALRPTIMGTRHMVSAGHYLAAHAGFEVLEAGGNAIDAGVATAIAIGVLQPDKVNCGGVAPAMIWLAERREMVTIDGLGVWPQAVTPEYFREHHGGRIPPGPVRSVVPAAPDAWLTALERFGTMSFGEVAAAAIRYARDGYPVHAQMAAYLEDRRPALERWPSSCAVFYPHGRALKPGEIFVQRDLARTLQHLADEEAAAAARGGRAAGLQAARDAFYRGEIARCIAEFHAASGGLLTREDLASFRVRLEAPVRARFGDYEVYACGPWCQGPVLPMTLNLLAGRDLVALGHNSTEYIHLLTQALSLAFSDRHHWFGDPRHVDVPIAGLLSRDYAAQRARLIRMERAYSAMPPPGDARGDGRPPSAPVPPPEPEGTLPGGDTSYACVVDRHGNAYSVTPSDGCEGAPIVPGLGLIVSPRGSQSWTDPRHPSCADAGKRPRLTPSPAIVLRGDRLFMPFGTPGGDVQPQAMLQVFLNIVVFGMDVQQALEAPRFSTYNFPGSFEPHPYLPGLVALEARVSGAVGAALARLGHRVHWWEDWTWLAGAACAIVVDPESGVLRGGADPRRPAYCLGW